MLDEQPQLDLPTQRVVLLGASNLIRGISTVVGMSRTVWGEPLDILAALGHGRSYGFSETRVLLRTLPGILACGIWEALAERPQTPTATLLTDIGNDMLYGADVDRITDWVEQCLQQVSRLPGRILVTQLPLESIAKMERWKFLIMRSMFFPQSRLRFQDALPHAEQLNHEVLRLARKYHAIVVKPRGDWYGFDPIHIRMQFWPQAWREIVVSWCDGPVTGNYSPSIRRWLVLRCLRPERRTLFGIVQRHPQPAHRLSDGTRISFY